MELTPLFWLIALPLAATPLVYLGGHLARLVASGADRRGEYARIVALAVLLGCWLPFALAAQALTRGETFTLAWGQLSLRLDGVGLLLAAVALALGTLVVPIPAPI